MYSFLCDIFGKKIKIFHTKLLKIMKDLLCEKHVVKLLPLLYVEGLSSQVPASF